MGKGRKERRSENDINFAVAHCRSMVASVGGDWIPVNRVGVVENRPHVRPPFHKIFTR